jgi:UDP-N-acetyl-D-galactosamine dehydrogenase
MGSYVASQLVKAMIRKKIQVEGSRILLLGLSFKENCPDIRNTRVVDIVKELRDFRCEINIFDPWVEAGEARHEYGIDIMAEPTEACYDAVVITVAHAQFRELGLTGIRRLCRPNAVVFDLKYVLSAAESDLRL